MDEILNRAAVFSNVSRSWIDSISFIKKHLLSPNGVVWDTVHENRFTRLGSCLPEIFSKTSLQTYGIQDDDVMNRAKLFFNRFTWMYLLGNPKFSPKPDFATLFRSIRCESCLENYFSIGSLGCIWQRVKPGHFQYKVYKPYMANCNVRQYLLKLESALKRLNDTVMRSYIYLFMIGTVRMDIDL